MTAMEADWQDRKIRFNPKEAKTRKAVEAILSFAYDDTTAWVRSDSTLERYGKRMANWTCTIPRAVIGLEFADEINSGIIGDVERRLDALGFGLHGVPAIKFGTTGSNIRRKLLFADEIHLSYLVPVETRATQQ